MTKTQYMNLIAQLYRAANTADSDNKAGAWMHPDMAGDAGCAALDKMLHEMVKCGVISNDELQLFHDEL